MKRTLLLLSAFLVIGSYANGQITGNIKFLINDFTIGDTLAPDQITYTHISSTKFRKMGEPGSPALPVAALNYLIP